MPEDKSVLGLETIRRNRGISLEQIAQATKISTRCLQAIEQGEFQKLPGGIYNTSYIRQYARAIDYDESAILAFYQRAVGATDSSAQASSDDKRKGLFGKFKPASLTGQ